MGNKEIDDRFKKFGTVSFTAISKVNDFIDGLEQNKVMGTKCPQCDIFFFPPRADCYKCQQDSIEWFNASERTGKLATFSKMRYGPVGFEDDLPYTIAVVDFSDFKIFGRIADEVPDESLKIGMEMTVVQNKLNDEQMNFVFQPV